jgi:hypothetical protein
MVASNGKGYSSRGVQVGRDPGANGETLQEDKTSSADKASNRMKHAVVECARLFVVLFKTQDSVDIFGGGRLGFRALHRNGQPDTCSAARRANFRASSSVWSPTFSARARASHLVRSSSSSSSVRCSMPTSELRAALTRTSSSSLT